VRTKNRERLKLKSPKPYEGAKENERSNEVQYNDRISDETLKWDVAEEIKGKNEEGSGIRKPNIEVVCQSW